MAFAFYGKRILNTKISSLILPKRHGYIVLVPEIGENLPDKNPLLEQNGLPEFNALTIENCMAAVGKQALDFEAGVRDIENRVVSHGVKDVFEDVIEPLEILGVPLDTTWGISKTLYLGNSILMPTKSYLSIHDRARRVRATKFNSPTIYNAVKNCLLEGKVVDNEKKRVLKKFKLEGKLNGLEITEGDKEKLEGYLYKLSNEKSDFKVKNDVATKLFKHKIDDIQVVRDFPVELMKAMAINPLDYHKGPWIVSLQPHIYLPFLEYCPDRELRWNIWQAMISRGSVSNNRELMTSIHLEEIRCYRKLQANVLGYKTFADMSMETKMAGSVQNVNNTFQILLRSAMPAQERELLDLYKFAVESGFNGSRIELWDVPYWRRKQQICLFNYKDEDFRDYFQLPIVLKGLFSLSEHLFKITIKQRLDVSVWNKDVCFYDIFEQNSSEPVAGFYFDPYVRTEKVIPSHNGWMVGIQNRSEIANIKPLAALVFSFQPPSNNKQTLLSFKEVNLLFFKFGHALQHLLTRTNYAEVAGSSNVEWDSVEVCGHVLTHWLYDKSTIENISKHYETEEKLPNNMFNSLVGMRRHSNSVDFCRELYLSALDLELHSTKDFWSDVVKKLWPRYRCFPLDRNDAHPCSFTQIFVDEWAAAYFSHVWARIIAADIYSAFQEVQNDKEQVVEVGKRFRDTFLALGGSLNPNEVFRLFRGRDPSPKALLITLGLRTMDK